MLVGDVECITTTKRPVCKFHGLPLDANGHCPYEEAEWPAVWDDDEVDELGAFEAGRRHGAAAERVRVVEGLVATIKALPVHHATSAMTPLYAREYREHALAVVEAAREDTT